MTLHVRTGAAASVVSVAVTLLMVCAPGVGASPVQPATSTASASWAYGTVHTGTASGKGGLYTYSGSLTAGFAVILNETTVSPGNFTIRTDRAMGLLLSVEYCRPSCAHPVESATVHYHAWERINATVNLTTHANVSTVDGTVPALGLLSSALEVEVGLRLTTSVVANGEQLRSRNLSANLNAASSTQFDPSLGLLPLNLSPAGAWNATSAFWETGYATWSLSDLLLVAGAGTPVHRTGNISLNLTGVVTLSGANPGVTVRLGGAKFDVLNLTVAKGPFDLREGFLLLPGGSDFFGGATPAWLSSNANETGSANVSQANIDVAGSLMTSGHLGFEGSVVRWQSATSNPATAVELPGGGQLPAVVSPMSGSNATLLQGTPVSLGQATADQACVAGGIGCPTGATPQGLLGRLLFFGGIGAAVVVAVAVIATRRRVPPPTYPNAGLYPPGPAGGPTTGANRPPARPPPPPEDDPLGNLW